jgi:hypothetical protein
MSRRLRDLLLGLALALTTLAGLLWQADRSASADPERASVPQLLCPLH